MKLPRSISVLFIIALQAITMSCRDPHVVVSPPGYDFGKPVVYKMPSVLEEISGMAFNNGNPDTVYAEQDEEGKVFHFHLGDAAVSHTKFSKKGDYEDVSICNGQVIMLRSDGVFFTFPISETSMKETESTKKQEGLLGDGEWESMSADENNHLLYLLCKTCKDDKTQRRVPGYVLSVGADGILAVKNQFSLDEAAILKMWGKDEGRLKTSGLARNPLNNQWYILSSVNKMLVVADANWKPLGAYALNPALFTQPEGIAFDKAGNMYVSNEKGNAVQGSILLFKHLK